jgi:diaminopimelate decarboxylase
MHQFRYLGNRLHCEGVAVDALASRAGTPLFVYSQATLTDRFQQLDTALRELDHLVCFSVKSNSNLSVLRVLANLGSGFDIVSAGELRRVIAAGADPRRCIFAGVGKAESEIEFALRRGVYCLNAESEPELERINRVAARLGKPAPVAVRVNPDVEAHTHAKITTGTYGNKFGVAFEKIEGVYARAHRLGHLRLRGLQMHIGSQIAAVTPFENAVRKVLPLLRRLQERYPLEFLSVGGGMGIVYRPALASGPAAWWRSPAARGLLTPQQYARRLLPWLRSAGLRILLEPGRFISGKARIRVTRVEYVKRTGRKNFIIVDAAMNDLIRPAFYEAYHEIIPVRRSAGPRITADVVGPVCESGDFFCRDRALPRVREGDYLALLSAGAYGSVMGSNYNTRALAAEVLVNGRRAALVRRRQPLPEIWAGESIAPWLDASHR